MKPTLITYHKGNRVPAGQLIPCHKRYHGKKKVDQQMQQRYQSLKHTLISAKKCQVKNTSTETGFKGPKLDTTFTVTFR